MYSKFINGVEEMVSDIPKEFWRYYDLYRREIISLEEYVLKSDLTEKEILQYLSII